MTHSAGFLRTVSRRGRFVAMLACGWWAGVLLEIPIALGARPPVPGKTRVAATNTTNTTAGEIRGWSVPYRKDGELKAKLSGSAARPLAGGELEIRDLKVETYRDGEPQAILSTPLCRYRPGDDSVVSTNSFGLRLTDNRGQLDGTGFDLRLGAKEVSSSGKFSASGPGGRLQLRGEGFRFRLESGQLTVSNHVQALLPLRLPKRLSP